MMIPADWITQAVERIAPHIQITPLTHDSKNDLYLKWENHQYTGSFKIRGALNKVLSLQDWERQRGLVTASAGNHGQGVALAGKLVQTSVIVFASEHATPKKVAAMQSLGAEVRLVPGGYGEAEQTAIQFATDNGATWISPYNDGQVIAGQATLGLEIMQQITDLRPSEWLIPAGGGGLAAGIGAAVKLNSTGNIKLSAVSSKASPYLHALYRTGSQEGIEEFPSLADGLAGPVEPGSVTIPMVKQSIDDFYLVSEDEVRRAIVFAWQKYKEKIEGSAGVALAAALYGHAAKRPAVVIITGGNIQPETHQRIVRVV
jgi:threonine dehydratase